jgi:hypothetical protein
MTSSTASTVLVDLEVYDPSGTRVFQQAWDNQAFNANQARVFNSTAWQPPSTAAIGTYTLAVGVFSPGWGTVNNWNPNAGSFSVTRAANPTNTAIPTPTNTPVPPVTTPQTTQAFTTGAAGAPANVVRGKPETINTWVKSAAAGSVLIDVEVYDSTGARVFQRTFDKQSFSAGETRTFQSTWIVPTSARVGTYTVKIGVFSPGWGTVYNWNDRAATFTVS